MLDSSVWLCGWLCFEVHISRRPSATGSVLNVLLRLPSLHWVHFPLNQRTDSMEIGILHNAGIIVSRVLLSFLKPWHIFISMIVYLDIGYFASESWFYRKESHKWQKCIYRKILFFFFLIESKATQKTLFMLKWLTGYLYRRQRRSVTWVFRIENEEMIWKAIVLESLLLGICTVSLKLIVLFTKMFTRKWM